MRASTLSTALLAAVASSTPLTALAQQAGSFEIIGDSGVSALLTVQTNNKYVYIVDKTENNSMQVDGHAAWGSEYNLETNEVRPMAVRSNTFCAGGVVLGNGTILNMGGNLAVTTNNTAVQPDDNQDNVYDTEDGRRGMRLLEPCQDGQDCEWYDSPDLQMNSPRWYPTPEILEDGSAIIFGGSTDGGYLNPSDNPTYEYFPSRGADVNMSFLSRTYPLNLYPLTWLLPDGRLFLQADYEAINFDHENNEEQRLPDIPYAFRVYPASAANWLTPLTSENNFTHTINFCGGNNLTAEELGPVYGPPAVDALNYGADDSCTRINPLDDNPTWEDFEFLPEGRVMGSALILPDLTTLVINGIRMGTAGYGAYNAADWMVAGQSYGDDPIYTPVLYDPKRPEGDRWTSEGFQASTIGRLYHSTAILLHDGSIFVSGSNPNADVETEHWHTEYRVERFYPSYFNASRRPQPSDLPDSLSYGGDPWDVTLSAEDLNNDAEGNIDKVMVTYVRPGYSTHAINFGQRAIKLDFSYSLTKEGGAILHVSQLPPNPAIFAPGPALLHVVVDGVPSEGKYVTAGNGQLGQQPVEAATQLPSNNTNKDDTSASDANSDATSLPSMFTPVTAIASMAALFLGRLVL